MSIKCNPMILFKCWKIVDQFIVNYVFADFLSVLLGLQSHQGVTVLLQNNSMLITVAEALSISTLLRLTTLYLTS